MRGLLRLAAALYLVWPFNGVSYADSKSLGGFATTFTNTTVAVVTWTDGVKPSSASYEVSYVLDGKSIARTTKDLSYIMTGLQPNTNYTVKVKRLTGGAGSEVSGRVQTTKAGGPKNVTQVGQNSTAVTVRWMRGDSEQPGVTYLARLFGTNFNISVNTTALYCTFTGLRPGNLYHVHVSSYPSVEADKAMAMARTSDPVPTAAPNGTRVLSSTSTEVTLGWNDIPSDSKNGAIISFSLRITSSAKCGSATWELKTGSGLPSYIIKNLKPDCNYSVSACGCTVTGCGPYSESYDFSTSSSAPGNAPTGVQVTFSNSTTVELQWDKMTEHVGIVYHYELWGQPPYECGFGHTSLYEETNSTMILFTGLKPYCYYSISVKGCTNEGCGPAAKFERFVTNQTAPSGAPNNYTLQNVTENTLSIKWGDVMESDRNGIITYYDVLLQSETMTIHLNATAKDNFTTTFEELSPDTTYNITVQAHTSGGRSNVSRMFNFTTLYGRPTEAPVNVSILSTTSTAVELLWKMPSFNIRNVRIFQYEVHVCKASDMTEYKKAIINSSDASVTATVSGLEPATNYSVTVIGRNLYGESPPSIAVYFNSHRARCQDSSYELGSPTFKFSLQESDVGQQINITVCDDNQEVLLAAKCVNNTTLYQPEFIIHNSTYENCSNQRLEVQDRFQILTKRSAEQIISQLLEYTSEVNSMSANDVSFIYDLLENTRRNIFLEKSILWDVVAANYGKVLSNFMDMDSLILSKVHPSLKGILSTFEDILSSLASESYNATKLTAKNTNWSNIAYKFPRNSNASWMCDCWKNDSHPAEKWDSNVSHCSPCNEILYPPMKEIEWYTAYRNDKLFGSTRLAVEGTVFGLRRSITKENASKVKMVEFKLRIPQGAPLLLCASWDLLNRTWLTKNCSQSCTSDFIICKCNATSDRYAVVEFNEANDALPIKGSGCWKMELGNESKAADLVYALNIVRALSSPKLKRGGKEEEGEIATIFAKMEMLNLTGFTRRNLEQMSLIMEDILSNLMDADDLDQATANSVTREMEAVLLAMAESMKLQDDTESKEFARSKGTLAYKVSTNEFTTGMSTDDFLNLSLTGRPPSRLELNKKLAGGSKAFIVYGNGKLFKDARQSNKPMTEILGAQVSGGNLSALSQDENMVAITFPLAEKVTVGRFVCAYWSYTLGGWHTDGCKTSSNISDRSIVCSCNHLTHFAVLLNPNYVESTELTLITMVGLGLSTCGLGFVVVTFILFRRMRQNDSQKTLFFLSLSLMALNLFFLAGIDRTEGESICTAMAVLIHYFLLTSFAWTLVEAVLQYLRLVKVLGSYVSSFMLKVSVPAWGVPAVIVAIIYGVNQESYLRYETNSGSERWLSSCWVSQQVLYYGVIAPVGCVLVVNTIMFSIIMYSLCCRKRLRSNVSDQKTAVLHLKAGLSIFVLLGITWVIGFVGMTDGHANITFQAIFCVLCSLTGVFIAFFNNLRERAVRDQWRTLCCRQTKHIDRRSSSNTKSASKQTRGSTSTIDLSLGNLVTESY